VGTGAISSASPAWESGSHFDIPNGKMTPSLDAAGWT